VTKQSLGDYLLEAVEVNHAALEWKAEGTWISQVYLCEDSFRGELESRHAMNIYGIGGRQASIRQRFMQTGTRRPKAKASY
jgi:hypothetical protein